MKEKKSAGLQGFLKENKMLLLCMVGLILLISFFNVQNVILSYEAEDGEQYVIRMDYTVFDFCMRCAPGSKNTGNIVTMESFTFNSKKASIVKAVEAMQELSGSENGTVRLQVNGLLPNNDQSTAELVEYLNSLGYHAAAVE